MSRQATIIEEQVLHDGYLQVTKCSLKVSSLSLNNKFISINDREVVITTDSVSVLLYAKAEDSFILCRQFRVGVFLNPNADNSFTLECVAGIIDEEEKPEETAMREIKEETGIHIKQLKLIANVYKSPGLITEKNYLFYAEATDLPAEKLHGVEDEEIETQVVKREKVYELMDNLQIIDAATLIALNWFRSTFK